MIFFNTRGADRLRTAVTIMMVAIIAVIGITPRTKRHFHTVDAVYSSTREAVFYHTLLISSDIACVAVVFQAIVTGVRLASIK